jgi:hypothetical protein
MAIISNTDLQAICDKLARWAAMSVGDDNFDDSFNAGMAAANAAVMSGSGSLFTYLFETVTDGDVAADMLSAARDLDESNPVPPTRFMIGIAGVSAFLASINTHLRRYAPSTPTLDAYLTSLNASTPTLRVHQALHDHLKSFSRKNVFIANDTVLATFSCTGAATGTFASVATIGTDYAGAKLVVKNQGAVTTGATLTVTGKKIDGSTQALTATIATGTDNTETDLSSVLRLFVEVTNVTISGGTNANVYEIVAKTDRDISAA